jgi:phage minor structural protein
MYKVKMDNRYIYHPWDKTLQINDPKLETELNKNGSFTFSVYPDNPFYNSFTEFKTRIKVISFDEKNNEKEIFCCRVLSEDMDFDGEKTITCEGNMAFLLDSIQRPYSGNYTPDTLFRLFISAHNDQMETEKQFKIGRITVSGEEVKYDESDYSDTRSAIENKLLNVYGGYIRTRKEKDGYYIDYLKEYEDVEGQTIQFGDNVLDISKYIKSDGIKTCIIPIGATNSATGKPITIKSVNNGMDYIYDQAAVDAFGMIFGTVNYSDVESPEILLKQAQEYIKDVVNLAITIELTAVDLKDAGFDVKELEIGDKIPVISKPHGIDSYMQISKVSKNLKQADDSKVTLGSTLKALTDKQVNNADSVSLRISEIRSKMYNLPGLSLEPITNEVLEGILN